MAVDRSFVEQNRAQTTRMRTLAANTSDADMQRRVGEHWTVSAAFAHLAFWDRRVLFVLDDTERNGKVNAPDMDIVVNDISLPLWLALPPREATRLAIESAEQLDKRLENFPPDLLEQLNTVNNRWLARYLHRTEHLDEVEAVLKA